MRYYSNLNDSWNGKKTFRVVVVPTYAVTMATGSTFGTVVTNARTCAGISEGCILAESLVGHARELTRRSCS